MKKIVILGAGITGLSTAYHLEKAGYKNYTLFEKENIAGGLCGTQKLEHSKGTFFFDYTGHVLHIRNPFIKTILREFLHKECNIEKRRAGILFKNNYINYPFQAHLSELPTKESKECLIGLLKTWAKGNSGKIPCNFKDWISYNFGDGISKSFMLPYNKKLWCFPLKKISSDWVNDFIPTPNMEDILDDFINPSNKSYGYNTDFYYPKSGGIEKLIHFFSNKIQNVNLNSTAISIDTKQKLVRFKNGNQVPFDKLVSTIPLPELIKLISPCPKNITSTAKKLRWNSLFVINFAINHKIKQKNHWIYVPGKEYKFYRIVFPSNLSKHNSPKGMGSISLEIATKPNVKTSLEKIIEDAINDLLKLNLINSRKSIITQSFIEIPYGYIIYDHNRENVLKIIHDFLRKHNIYSTGRYGAWHYSFIEKNVIEGKSTADCIFKKV